MRSTEGFLFETCCIYARHVLNACRFNQAMKAQGHEAQSYGLNSRLLPHLCHPEDQLIFRGYSKNKHRGEGIRHCEHVVPLSYIQWHAVDYLKNCLAEPVFNEADAIHQLACDVYQSLGIVYVTQEEARRLDGKNGLKTTMPDDWAFGADPIARLWAVDIELVDEQGNAINSLLRKRPDEDGLRA